jgi:hypothetical protein
MAPRGVGSSQCESVRSLICRLALAHTVSYRILIRYIVEKRSASSKNGELLSRDVWRSLLFAGPLIKEIADATGIQDVMFCTLNALARVIDFTNCIDGLSMRCCPLCMKENPFPGAWDPLIWSIEPVVACPKHRVLLVSPECASREYGRDLSRRCLAPGVCRHCGSLEFKCSTLTTRRATNNQIWFAEQVGTLISATSSGEEFDRAVATAALKTLLKERFGTMREAERTCGLSNDYLHGKLSAGHRIGLQQMLTLCGRLQIEVLPLLRGKVVDAEFPHILKFSGQWLRTPCPKRPTRETIEAVILDDPAISLLGLCRRMKINKKTLEHWFPDLASDLRAKAAVRRGQARWRGLLRRGRKLRRACRELANAGLPFTEHYLSNQCGMHQRHTGRYGELFKRMQAKEQAKKDRDSI